MESNYEKMVRKELHSISGSLSSIAKSLDTLMGILVAVAPKEEIETGVDYFNDEDDDSDWVKSIDDMVNKISGGRNE